MSISLIGIIFVQSFWIKTTLDNRERQFSLNVNQALKAVTESIKDESAILFLSRIVLQEMTLVLYVLSNCFFTKYNC